MREWWVGIGLVAAAAAAAATVLSAAEGMSQAETVGYGRHEEDKGCLDSHVDSQPPHTERTPDVTSCVCREGTVAKPFYGLSCCAAV